MKEILWTLVHKQKSSRAAYWATQVDIFRETAFRPLGGAAPSKFSHTLEIEQGYVGHTTTGTGVPKNICKNLKFGLKC